MKTIASAATVLLLLGAGASAQTLDDLKNDGKNTDNILTYGMGYHQQRYSPLKQINKQTVKRLVPVWNLSLDNNWGEQAQPIVYNGVMYVTNARRPSRSTSRTGKQIWKHTLDWPRGDPARRLLRRLQQGRGDLQRQDLPHHARCPSARARRQDRQGDLEVEGRRMEGRLFAHAGAADRERRPGHRQFRRRVRHSRLHRRLGSRDRQAALAPLHHSGARREGQRDLAAEQQRLGGRRRLGLDHRLVRSRARPDVLGHRQSGAVGVADPRPATISTPPRCWRCGRRPARSSGTTSSRPTTPTTTTPAGS